MSLQLIKVNWPCDNGHFSVEILDKFVNLGPIVDLCIVNTHEREDQQLVVTCSGGFQDGSLRIVQKGIVINQQATESRIRLISASTRKLVAEWSSATGFINVATAIGSQVLVARRGGEVVHLEIGEGRLTENDCKRVENEISCMAIKAEADPQQPLHAAVGMWTDATVAILSLPSLDITRKVHLGGNIILRSLLFCELEGISYLLCARGDGQLFIFEFNASSGQLTEIMNISLGSKPLTLRIFLLRNEIHVIAASDRATLISSMNHILHFDNINLTQVNHVCPFNSSAFPNSLAIATKETFSIQTVGDAKNFHIRTIPLEEHARRICHQVQSHTCVICSTKYSMKNMDEIETRFVRLIDDTTFDVISSYQLHKYENGCSIVSCSFKDDDNVYYCIGTARALPTENEPKRSEQSESVIREVARDFNVKWVTSMQILEENTYLAADNLFNLYTTARNTRESASYSEWRTLAVVGKYHLGEFVNRFVRGGKKLGGFPTLLFGTVNGVLGLVASLPQEQFEVLQQLQRELEKRMNGVGVGSLSHAEWRSFTDPSHHTTDAALNFVDGDLIQSFLLLPSSERDEIAAAMNMPPNDLSVRVAELSRLF